MLALRQDPTAHGVAHYAALLEMSYSGAGKFMMELRGRGLIRRKAYSTHELSAQGDAYVQEALQPQPGFLREKEGPADRKCRNKFGTLQ